MRACADRAPVLVVSASGRALAQSAARAGIPVVVLDLFNDMDTRALAVASRGVAGKSARMDARKLLAAADALCAARHGGGLVFGSGFESRTPLLERLAAGRRLHGNKPEVVARLKDPVRFSGMLHALGATHPEVRLLPPGSPQGWLAKRAGAAGGAHVKPASRRHRAGAGRYFQRRAQGRNLSALFAADGRAARIIGFNEQWAAPTGRAPYRYGGAVGIPELPDRVAREVERVVAGLVREAGLVGLNGLDFLLDEQDSVCVIELNPRPTATVDLHDADYARGLFAVHLDACGGILPAPRAAYHERAHAIVYAAQPLHAPATSHWPRWCTDIPPPGSPIPAGAPVCSVHAQAAGGIDARQLVLRRQAELLDSLSRRAA